MFCDRQIVIQFTDWRHCCVYMDDRLMIHRERTQNKKIEESFSLHFVDSQCVMYAGLPSNWSYLWDVFEFHFLLLLWSDEQIRSYRILSREFPSLRSVTILMYILLVDINLRPRAAHHKHRIDIVGPWKKNCLFFLINKISNINDSQCERMLFVILISRIIRITKTYIE